MARKHGGRMHGTDFPPLEGAFDAFLDNLVPPGFINEGGMAVLGGASAILISDQAFTRIGFLHSLPGWGKRLAELGAAVVLGRAAWEFNPDAAKGALGGAGGLAVARLVADLANIDNSLGEFAQFPREVNTMSQLPEERDLVGLGAPVVEQRLPMGPLEGWEGFAATNVEERHPLASFLGGY